MAFVMWNWTWVDPADCIPPYASDSEGNASPLNDIDLTSDETGSDEPIMDEEVPTITHPLLCSSVLAVIKSTGIRNYSQWPIKRLKMDQQFQ